MFSVVGLTRTGSESGCFGSSSNSESIVYPLQLFFNGKALTFNRISVLAPFIGQGYYVLVNPWLSCNSRYPHWLSSYPPSGGCPLYHSFIYDVLAIFTLCCRRERRSSTSFVAWANVSHVLAAYSPSVKFSLYRVAEKICVIPTDSEARFPYRLGDKFHAVNEKVQVACPVLRYNLSGEVGHVIDGLFLRTGPYRVEQFFDWLVAEGVLIKEDYGTRPPAGKTR